MPSLKTTLTLDGTQYDQALMRARAAAATAGTGIERSLTRLQSTSQAVGANINKAFSAESFHPSTGAMREFMVLLREIGRGNWSRVPGSLTILMSYLAGMRDVAAGIVTPARAAADAYQLQALRANEAAIASLRKAQAAETAFLVECDRSRPTRRSADCSQLKTWRRSAPPPLEIPPCATGLPVRDAGRSVFHNVSWKQGRNEFSTGCLFFEGGNLAFSYQAASPCFLCG